MKAKLLLSLLALGSISLSGCYLDLGFLKIGTKPEEQESGDDLPEELPEVPVDEYYKSYNLNLQGGRLINELQKMSWETHKNWITYSQIASYYATTSDHLSVDAIKEGSKVNQYYYTGKEATGYVSGSNREHVWPCANSANLWTHDKPDAGDFNPHYVDFTYYVGGGSDLYHVRPCQGDVNTARGNSRFVCFDDPEYAERKDQVVSFGESSGKWELKLLGATPVGSKYQYANQCEPDDNMKGDVARLVLYVYMHYSDRGITPEGSVTKGSSKTTYTYKYSDMTGSLSLTNIMGYDSNDRCVETLIKWNKLDPVSSVELLRNETVSKIQGNRNPFVDHPELVEAMFA